MAATACPGHRKSGRYAARISALAADLRYPWVVSVMPTQGFNWLEFSPVGGQMPSQGWKVHVSLAAHEAEEFVKTVIPELLRLGATFKIPDTQAGIVRLNAGDAGALQLGKIATVYPADLSSLNEIVNALRIAWPKTAGPAVTTDLRVVGTNAIYVRYGAFRRDGVLIDALGRHQLSVVSPSGEREVDLRMMSGHQPDWAGPVPIPAQTIAQEKMVSVADGEFIPILLLNARPKGQVYLGMRVSDGTAVIIKTAKRGVAGDQRGFDACAKLRNEWKNIKDLGSGPREVAPLVLHFSESDSGAVLVFADNGAATLEQKHKEEQIAAIPLIAAAIDALHEYGIVHRDVKLQNIITSGASIGLIDFELAAKIGETCIPEGGTWGHVPPEGGDDIATVAADRYAFGALAAGIYLGCSPSDLPRGSGRLLGLLRVSGYSALIPHIRELTDAAPEKRPKLAHASQRLSAAFANQCCGATSAILPTTNNERNWIRRAALDAAIGCRSFRDCNPSGVRWRNNHIEADYHCEGINLGSAGIILGLAVVQSQLGMRNFDSDIVSGARFLSSSDYEFSAPGFFIGSAGVAVALTVASHIAGDEAILEAARCRLMHALAGVREHDLFFGSAGVLWAASIIFEITGAEWARQVGDAMLHRLMNHAQREAGLVVWPFASEFERSTSGFIGAAHGSAGIAMAISCWAQTTRNRGAMDLAVETLHSIPTHGVVIHNGKQQIRRRVGSEMAANPREWCHGTLGYLWCILASGIEDGRLVHAREWAVDAINGLPCTANPTYCHGMSGELEVFRMLAAIDVHGAKSFAMQQMLVARLRAIHQKREGRILWGSEDPRIVTPDLWLGFLAPATALLLTLNDVRAPILSSQTLRVAARKDY